MEAAAVGEEDVQAELPAKLAAISLSGQQPSVAPAEPVQHQEQAAGAMGGGDYGSEGSLGDEGDDGEGGGGVAGIGSNGEPHERCVLEDFTQCSQSHLWKLMMSFYDRKGVESWSQGIVPHFITCNSFIGRSYAHVLCGFLRDCMTAKSTMPLDQTQPLYIIELGAGSGKFSFFMLKALLQMKDMCDFPLEKIVFVMTDFTESNFKFWADHPALKPFVQSGQLDMAIFDAVNDTSITLSCSGVTLSPGSCVNPVCIVANYLFDTLCHDIFQVDGRQLKEGLISVGSKRPAEADPLDPEIIKRFDNKFCYRDISEDYYKGEEVDAVTFRRILHWYVDHFSPSPAGASILFPIGALRALRRLLSFSGNRAIVISGDKGNNNPDQFRGLADPHIAVHGSFSVMVNYHAIGAYFTARGGFALHNPQEEASLKVSAFVATGDVHAAGGVTADDGQWTGGAFEAKDEARSRLFPNLAGAFKYHVEHFGPNDFFVMQKGLKEDAPSPSLRTVVALLKLGDWDPDVFYKFRDVILNQVPTSGLKLRKDLCRGVPRVWENYYMLDKDKDVAFEIGRFYYGIRDYSHALEYYKFSSDHIGEHHVTRHNIGLCYYSMGNMTMATQNFDAALRLNPEYDKAHSWKQKVQQELAAAAAAAAAVSAAPMADGAPLPSAPPAAAAPAPAAAVPAPAGGMAAAAAEAAAAVGDTSAAMSPPPPAP
eukprot:TRINITY_DN15453_c0_g1_i2.p1 TRINITY_DN15453_c0_g1~~TRINITY_DN15453_c0_g1_i2.p1  ORF type:complete len:728 (-),score=271.29 TRINITY_DN15453_c0_g1_i2:407-2533(-)